GSYASVVSVYHVPEQVFTMSPDRTPTGRGDNRGRNAAFFSIPPRCLFLFTYPRAMLSLNSFNGFMIDVGIKEKQRQAA
ncbi:hypothetical protein VB266_05645, partial [Enterobacter bugandensis]|uniref:hypothetical protein n=1 Tax=Enterobacter bugandensis TaxID=881260 RepID=UPI002B216DE1